MVTTCLLLVALAVQNDPDQAARKLLDMSIDFNAQNAPLQQLVGFMEDFYSKPLPLYIDPVEVQKPDEIEIVSAIKGTLDEVLKEILAPHKLQHIVWQGIVLITTEKGKKDFANTDWTGLSKKAVNAHKELSKRLQTVYDFEWSPYDPKKALAVLAKTSGVAIKTDDLPDEEAKPTNDALLYPRQLTLGAALTCLSRATGITYEIAKDGAIVAKPPKDSTKKR